MTKEKWRKSDFRDWIAEYWNSAPNSSLESSWNKMESEFMYVGRWWEFSGEFIYVALGFERFWNIEETNIPSKIFALMQINCYLYDPEI